MNKDKFSHVNEKNNPCMVDVSDKKETVRFAHAQAIITLPQEVMVHFSGGEINSKKGPVFHTAIIAGTMATKKTSDLIPFCHPLIIDACDLQIEVVNQFDVRIDCKVKIAGKTGVEMEALTGASVAALTVYDMCKAFSHAMTLHDIKLIKKTGGKS
ncbi:MAG: cyclic pyranopterin monophosphate synthase MoaC [Bacteriovoracaceae bacterium]|nr:cyclic pyranopterin monophosphate synthase MoaC [Bacteriovoracaceae bacterium]